MRAGLSHGVPGPGMPVVSCALAIGSREQSPGGVPKCLRVGAGGRAVLGQGLGEAPGGRAWLSFGST